MYHSNLARTAQRRADVQAYIEGHLLDPSRTFCCTHFNTSCLPSARAAGLTFSEGEMPHVGKHYDIADDAGRQYRVVVVGQERGRGVPRATMDDWWKRIMQVSRREITPDPTIKGIMYALMELYGLSRHSSGTPEGESIDVDGSAVHVLDCFALTNATLCSATPAGQPTKGRATREMRTNCARHLTALLGILQPTVLVLLGKSARDAAASALHTVLQQDEPVRVSVNGAACDVLPFAHPLNRESQWRSPHSRYLRDTVLPALQGERPGNVAHAARVVERPSLGSREPAKRPSATATAPPPPLPGRDAGRLSLLPSWNAANTLTEISAKAGLIGPVLGTIAGETGTVAVGFGGAVMLAPSADTQHVMLVGCLQETETQRVLDEFERDGVAASPWSFRLTSEQQAALGDCPYLYVYRPASSWLSPKQAVVECLRVDGWKTKSYGIPCPWPGLGQPYGQTTTLLDGKDIKTWFRIVGRTVLSTPITARDARRSRDGQPVNPSSPGLLSSFSLWMLNEGSPISLPCLGN